LIERQHIATFSQVCKNNIQASSDDVIKAIYLRRLYEVHGDLDAGYDILSSLLHVRDTASAKGQNGELIPLQAGVLTAGLEKIRQQIPGFDYTALVRELADPATVKARFDATDVGYEKVQIFRTLSADARQSKGDDEAFQKFVNESHHIENEYMMQLNPRDFDAVPEHVVLKCKLLLDNAAS
ncbi:MAG: hypothetical protein JWR55_112, partial [Aeromicrobium sp.]|nr:hypothetical protein [Aeromicrobium sp.]